MSGQLTADRVEHIFFDCLYEEDEVAWPGVPPEGAVVVEGIMNTVAFHPERLESYRQSVTEMLADLPTEFHQSGGGGWSFLQACMDKDGHQWTGLHRTMDQLFCVGMGLGLVEYQLPRSMWSVLPGSMPYYVVKL